MSNRSPSFDSPAERARIAAASGVSTADVAKLLDYLALTAVAQREPAEDVTYGDLVEQSIAALEEGRARYREALSEERVPPEFPAHLQVQTIGGCNAACVMCAMSNPEIRRFQKGRMSPALFTRIVDECAEQEGCREVALYLQNEPLLDPDLAARVRYVKERSSGRLMTRVVTNGSLLTGRRIDELLAAGLDRIAISLNAFTPEVYRLVMGGLELDQTLANLELLLAKAPGTMLISLTFMVTALNQHEIEPAIDYWSSRGVLCGAYGINTMSGTVRDFEQVRATAAPERERAKECYLPLESTAILASGEVLLCCADWTRSSACGSLEHRTLWDVWHSPALAELRRQAIRERFPHEVCKACLGQTRVRDNLLYEGGPRRAGRKESAHERR
jgi:MoaA/NifB/PqqE/SkfB family radical SAM enzyme